MNKPIPVVINADDFGYSCGVNAVIAQALQQRRISSATLIANAPATEQAVRIAAEHPQASFGIHLNLTEFTPLTNHLIWARFGLLNQLGQFNGQLRSRRPSPALLRACAQEFDAQCRRLLALGLQPSHLDSHHHVHTIAWLWPALVWLQKHQRLPLLRNTMNVYVQDRPVSRKLLLAKQLWQFACLQLARSRTTALFTDIDIFWQNPRRPCLLKALSLELMCHPGQQGFEQQTRRLLSPQSDPLPDPFVLVPFPQACAVSCQP
jgi:predicted glycoside hydrolase/deacetylase ChbG (UPF0249 family)